MTWNYRIIKKPTECPGISSYQIHEVYYNKNYEPMYMTSEPCSLGCNDTDDDQAQSDIVQALEHALLDAKRHPIFVEPEEWAEEDIDYPVRIKTKDGSVEDFLCHCGGRMEEMLLADFNDNDDLDDPNTWTAEKSGKCICIKCCNIMSMDGLDIVEE